MAVSNVIHKDSIVVDGTHDNGLKQQLRITARVIGAGPEAVYKSEGSNPAWQVAQSQGIDAEDEKDPLAGYKGIIDPPHNLYNLANMWMMSTELGQCQESMVTNTVGFGWRLKERPMPDDVRANFEKEIREERYRLLAKLGAVHPKYSLTALRRMKVFDKESCGNGYLELIEDMKGDLVGLDHIHGHTIRLIKREKDPTKIEVPRVRPDLNFTIEQVPFFYRFRKYVQQRSGKRVFFKEAGDPRVMDKRTGEYLSGAKAKKLPIGLRATSLIHDRIYASSTAYGVPRYIGNMFSILGSRTADETNYKTISQNHVPSMFIIVENGTLTSSSIKRLQQFTEQQIAKAGNRSKFIILEGETLDDGDPSPDAFRIKVIPLTNEQIKDQLFQEYDKNNRDKVRQSFRLPPIFVGRSEDYNRATADTSKAIADEQVFAPERDQMDFQFNRHVLARWGVRFHVFRTNHPNITDDIELIRMMAIGERSGAMTPYRADKIMRDIWGGDELGPMPKGVDLHTPFSLQFAQAQSGKRGTDSATSGGDSTGRMVSDLLTLRKRIADELDRRQLEPDEDEWFLGV